MQGAGLGNIFKTIIRTTTPLIKKIIGSEIVKKNAKRALKIGSEEFSNFAQDVLAGAPVAKAAKIRGKSALTKLQTGQGKKKNRRLKSIFD